MKIFISHSSKDKETYVNPVVELLYQEKGIGKESIILDEITFYPGSKTKDEIEKYLKIADLFVIFLSKDSIDSNWVQFELASFKKELDNRYPNKGICPIIIDNELQYDNPKIPNWMREEYNLRPVLKKRKIVTVIKSALFDLYSENNELKKRFKLFVGRNDYLAAFEKRMDDFDKLKPIIIIGSGFNSIGRKSLLEQCLLKSNIIRNGYFFPKVPFSDKESIEDFILKIADLELTQKVSIQEVAQKELDEKTLILKKIILELQEQNEIIMVADNGGIIDFQGNVVNWFLNVLKDEEIKDQITFCITSKFRFTNFEQAREVADRIFSMEVAELNKVERGGLLRRYLELENINLENSLLKEIAEELLTGYPTQVFYIVSLIKNNGIDYFKNNRHLAIDYVKNKSAVLLKDLEKNQEKVNFLVLLSKFDGISLKTLIDVFGENYNKYISEFILLGICEYVGILKEGIRLNDIIKDYISRSYYELSEEYLNKLEIYISNKLKEMEKDNYYYDIPEILFHLKESLLKGKNIDSKLLIPSVYLQGISELYNRGKNRDVILFCEKALENERYMDISITSEIRYFLCLSLAKLRKRKFLEEVQKINGPNHNFLYGFYYRQIGKFNLAIQKLDKAIEERQNFSKAKREKVQCYIGMREFDRALQLAQENYENYPENPYHIQAYFSCLVKSENHNNIDKNNKFIEILEELIEKLENNKAEFTKEMALRCKAQMYAFCLHDYDNAIGFIEQAIKLEPNLFYAKLAKFDICEKFNDLEGMEKVYNDLMSQKDFKDRHSHVYVMFHSLILAKKGEIDKAKNYFLEKISSFTDEAKNLFLEKLENLNKREILK